MRALLALALYLPLQAAIAFVQAPANGNACGSVTSCNLAFGSNTGAGSLIVVVGRVGATGRTITVTDTQSSSYSLGCQQVITSDSSELFVHYAMNTAGGANTVTWAISGAAATVRFTIMEVSGAATSSVLDGCSGAEASSTTLTGGTVNTTVANVLLLGAGQNTNSVTFTAGSGYTLRSVVPATNERLMIETQVVSSTGAYTATATQSTSLAYAMITAAFKEASGGGPAAPTRPRIIITKKESDETRTPHARARRRTFGAKPIGNAYLD